MYVIDLELKSFMNYQIEWDLMYNSIALYVHPDDKEWLSELIKNEKKKESEKEKDILQLAYDGMQVPLEDEETFKEFFKGDKDSFLNDIFHQTRLVRINQDKKFYIPVKEIVKEK